MTEVTVKKGNNLTDKLSADKLSISEDQKIAEVAAETVFF